MEVAALQSNDVIAELGSVQDRPLQDLLYIPSNTHIAMLDSNLAFFINRDRYTFKNVNFPQK